MSRSLIFMMQLRACVPAFSWLCGCLFNVCIVSCVAYVQYIMFEEEAIRW